MHPTSLEAILKRVVSTKDLALLHISTLLVVILSLGAFTAGCSMLSTEPYTFNGLRFEDPMEAPDFTLIDQHHQMVGLKDLRGNIVLLFFGFTNCPDACPATLGTWKRVQDLLGENSEHVRFIMITVDPERDTPERLARHLSLFSPAFIGLSGTVEEIEDVAQNYNVFFEKVDVGSASGYVVNHTTLTYVIDANGDLVLAHRSYETRAQEIVDDLAQLLK